jgi:hypothetical protein
MAEGDQDQANFGGSVGSAGDTNGDGTDEWVVGAPQYDRGQTDEGIAVLFSSLSTGPLPTPIPVTPPPPTPTQAALQMHISDLDGSASSVRNTWTAQVTVEVRASNGTSLSQAAVSGNWSTGSSGQCTTGANGRCTIQLSGLSKKVGSVSFTGSNVQHGQDVYQPSENTDTDGDSNGTSITIQKP